QGLVAGPSSGNGARPDGQGGYGGNLGKGYGRSPYRPAVEMGHFGGPQPARNQGKAYGGNGYRNQPTKGFGGSYGGAGLSLGPRYGNGAKGPMKGYSDSADVSNGKGSQSNGHAGVRSPNSKGAMPNGYGNPRTGAAKAAKRGFSNILNGHGAILNGYSNGATPNGYGSKPKGYGAAAGAVKGYGPQMNGYGLVDGKGQAVRGADLSNGKSLKGGVLSSQQQTAAAVDGGVVQQVQDKMYKQTQLNLESNPQSGQAIPAIYPNPQPGPEPAPLDLQEKGQKGPKYRSVPEPGAVLPSDGTADRESNRSIKTKAVAGSEAAESTENTPPEDALSMAAAKKTAQGSLPGGETENGRVSVSSSQGAKPAKPDCGPTGQWMKRLRSGYNAGGLNFPGLSNGHGAGLGYPYGGKIAQPGYGQGLYPAAGYGNGNLYGGNMGPGKAAKSRSEPVNSYGVVGQPDYATLGQVMHTAEQSGGTRQVSFSEAPVVPAGIDGISQLETHPAGLLPNGAPPSGQSLGMAAEKSNTKYGVDGLQFGQPVNLGVNGAGNYGYRFNPYGPAGEAKATGNYGYGGLPNGGQPLGLGSNGNIPGKYGYGTLPYEAQPAGLTPEAKSRGQYGLIGSPNHPAPSGFGYNGKSIAKYGGGEVPYAPQILGFGGEAKSGKYAGKQEAYQSQPLESAARETAGLIYDRQTTETESAGKPYVKGELPSSAFAVQENVGYIKGHVKPDAGAFPAAPTPSPTLQYSFTPDEGVQDLSDTDGTASFFESAPATGTRGEVHMSEHPDDLQLPRQIQIQQQLRLHFHPQGGKKYDLNGFFGNSDH
ncbi:hypothetical protein ATANTOWER_029378, partial [Ataeniobius toweri]|nr:hypothetical protein [Ataeniobius toweri]